VAHPQRGAPVVDHHNHVFYGKGHRVALTGDLIDFHVSGERPCGHEILHHATVLELVLDWVGVVRASLLKELLEVVRGRLRLTLASACDGHDVHHNGAACLLVDAIIIVDRGCGLLAALLAPLLATLGAHFGILDDDIG
jgi:hypothetical protein